MGIYPRPAWNGLVKIRTYRSFPVKRIDIVVCYEFVCTVVIGQLSVYDYFVTNLYQTLFIETNAADIFASIDFKFAGLV